MRPLGRAPLTDAHLEALLPAAAGRDVVPAAAFNVAAQLCALEAGIVDGVAAESDLRARRVVDDRAGRAHAVQDHLEATFAKTGADSRRQLVARATGTG